MPPPPPAEAARVVPAYGSHSLAELLPSVAAALGVAEANPLRLEPVRDACVLLVDGLGWNALCRLAHGASFLRGLVASGRALTSPFPSTTATSLATLGTGTPPAWHGVVGLEMAVPGRRETLNCLHWDSGVDARAWQPTPTWFERLVRAGVEVIRVGPGSFEGGGLTEATVRGGRHLAAESSGELVAGVRAALASDGGRRSAGSRPRSVYAYYGGLDGTGHRSGCPSPAWSLELEHVDLLVQQLAEGLPPGAALWITADHGMVSVGPQDLIDLADEPELDSGVRLLAGEPRARYLHTAPGARGDVLAAWRDRLGNRADVLRREEAIALGLFGQRFRAGVPARIGDVVVVSRDGLAVVDRRRMPAHVLRLAGLHGALTSDEVLVPLLEVRRD